MKLLCMLLVLANFGLFAWQHWHAPAEGAAGTGHRVVIAEAGLGKGLQLVGEGVVSETERAADNQPVAEVSAPPVPEPATNDEAGSRTADEAGPSSAPTPAADADLLAQSPTSCATLGPFDELALAQLARERLAAAGSAAAVRESGGQIRSGFWVYLPPFASRAAAKETENGLREKGVQDLFIVTGSEQRNAISLGLFSTPERADQRAAEIGRLGYAPRVAERFRDATVYWVDFRERADNPLEPESLGVPASGDTLPEKRAIACSEIADDAGDA